MVTPPPVEDVERIAETIDNLDSFPRNISDEDSFIQAYEDYLQDVDLADNIKFRDRVFDKFLKLRTDVSDERLFTKARGKDLRRDRRTTAKRIVTSKKQYIKEGATRTDLKGYDTKQRFSIVGIVKNKVVYTEKVSVVVKGKRIVKYRDSKGRFASIRK